MNELRERLGDTLTPHEKAACLVENRMARWHRNRLIPVIKGGATYTPVAVIGPTSLAATAGTSLLTGVTSTVYVVRTWHIDTNAASKTFTVSVGADAAGTRLFDAYALSASIPYVDNGWYPVTAAGGTHTFDGNCSAATVVLYAGGYTFV